jgi:hypothetical protein
MKIFTLIIVFNYFAPKWFIMKGARMKSITIHNLDDELYSLIRIEAKKNRRSMNQEIKDKLISYFYEQAKDRKDLSFKKYLGIWSESDYQEFINNIEDFGKISEGDWK